MIATDTRIREAGASLVFGGALQYGLKARSVYGIFQGFASLETGYVAGGNL